MNFKTLKIAGVWVERHLPELLTGAAITSVPMLVGTTVKATLNTKEKIDQLTDYSDYSGAPVDTLDKVKACYKFWIPPAATATIMLACVIGANHLHLKKETALAAVGTLWKGKYSDLEKAVKSELSDKESSKVMDSARNNEMENALGGKKLADAQNGKFKVYEPYSKQFLDLSQQDILWAELTLNKILSTKENVTLNEFLRLLPGAKTIYSGEQIGWFRGSASWGQRWGIYEHAWIDLQTYRSSISGKDVMYLNFSVPPDIEDIETGKLNDILYSR